MEEPVTYANEKIIKKEKVVEIARVVQDSIYNYGKAKIFNILEATLEGQKLEAAKRMVEDVLDKIGYENNIIVRSLMEE